MTEDLQDLLGEGAYGYFAGGAGDELTLRENAASWSRIGFAPRMLTDVSVRDTSVQVLGERQPHPLVVAPMAFQRHAHPEGESGMIRAAAATSSTFVLSSLTSTAPAEVAAAGPGVRRWFQLYVFRDRGISYELVAEAKEAGFSALVVTVDFPIGGWRDRDRRSGFEVAYPVAVNPGGAPMTTAELFAQIDPGLTWPDVASFAASAGLPVIVKGVVRADDARRAVDAGARAVVVSNHGGRQLDTVASGAAALPAVADAVGSDVDVLVDGGIRRGWDVAKALCLGADAVLVGRTALWGLARGGADGAASALQQLVDEFDNTLALLGCASATGLDRSYLL